MFSQNHRKNLTIFDDRFVGKPKGITILPVSMLQEKKPIADTDIFPPTFLEKIDILRNLASRAREFVLVHPTTPPLPGTFFKGDVSTVASMMILDPDYLTRYIMEGANTTLFKNSSTKVYYF